MAGCNTPETREQATKPRHLEEEMPPPENMPDEDMMRDQLMMNGDAMHLDSVRGEG